jgi:hypothetical protein
MAGLDDELLLQVQSGKSRRLDNQLQACKPERKCQTLMDGCLGELASPLLLSCKL